MSKEPTDRPNERDAELQREIRSHRKFNMAEAIGRAGGADMLKGASPVTHKRQAELEITQYLESHQVDVGVTFENVLARHVVESAPMLERGYKQPLIALKLMIKRLLRSDELLREFVREIDAEWGRVNRERPFFEQANEPPSPDDPYTIASVRNTLSRLMKDFPGD